MKPAHSILFRLISLVTVLFFAVPSRVRAAYIASDWNLSTVVTSLTEPTSVQRFTQVNSPFQETSFASIGLHSAQAHYDFDFQSELNMGTFDTQVELLVGAANGIQSSLNARVRVTPDIDTPIHLDASLNYATPTTPVVDVSFLFVVFDIANPNSPVYLGAASGGTISLNPAVGTFTRVADRVLLANHTYQIQWNTSIRTVGSPVPAGPSTVSGHFNWSVTPEPAALGLLTFAALFIRRPRMQAS